VVSAAQLAADAAAVDAAVAAVAVADQNLAQATLAAPMTGVVSAVGVTVGQTVSAGSTSSAIDIIDPTAHSVSLAVDVTKIPLVKVGQKAQVAPDGTGSLLDATVTYVAAAPSSSSSTSYQVLLTFTGSPSGLRDGIQAAVTVVVAEAANTLSVPSSAVQHLGSLSYVTVVTGTTTKRQIVTVGAIGPQYTQITQGLTAGQTVMLADLAAPIPTSTLNSRFARIAGAGGLGGLGGTGGLGGAGGFGGTGTGGGRTGAGTGTGAGR